MKCRPILFNGDMVRAILEGRKTQTRRPVKPQPTINEVGSLCWNGRSHGQTLEGAPYTSELLKSCPYGQPGDRLWVRETWSSDHRDVYPCYDVVYRADGVVSERDSTGHISACTEAMRAAGRQHGECLACAGFRWRPSIHMPRWASRLTLEVVSVRVERLHDITAEDAIADGLTRMPSEDGTLMWWGAAGRSFLGARRAFEHLWTSINGSESWATNPWVWVVQFRRVEDVQHDRAPI